MKNKGDQKDVHFERVKIEVEFVPFSGILGQEKVVRFLKGVLAKERVPHAYLFLGPPGVGKTTTALAMAQALNCTQPQKGEGCRRCRTCLEIEPGESDYFRIIRPESHVIKIEQIRELERVLSFKFAEGKYRVTLLRESERMNEESANAFLKTLEEPPGGNVLILHASDLSRLPATIISRCQKVRFEPVPVPIVAEWLVRKKSMDQEKALLLSKLSEGSIGRASRMLEEDFLSRRSECFSRLTDLVHLSDGEALSLALELKGKGGREPGKGELESLLGLWKTWMRDLLLLKTGAPERLVIHTDFLEQLKTAGEAYKIDSLIEALGLLDRAEKDLSRFRNTELMLENLLLALKGLGAKGRGAMPAKGVNP